jgi:hypothetical protein
MRNGLAWAIAAGLGCPAFIPAAYAQDDGARFGFALEADLEYGGDDFATVSFTDGSSQHIKTGQGVTLALGGHFKPSEGSPFGIRATVGYKFVTTAAQNADIGIERTVIEALGSYRLASDVWFAAGVTHHSGIEFDGDGFGPDLEFDDATGLTAEIGWKWIALSYTNMDYQDEFGGEWDASNLGLTLIAQF